MILINEYEEEAKKKKVNGNRVEKMVRRMPLLIIVQQHVSKSKIIKLLYKEQIHFWEL